MIKELGVHEGKPKVPETPVESVSTATKTLQWEPEALKRLEKVPVFVRWMAKSTIENHAREKGLSTITVALMEEARHLYGN
ncbi:MAG: PCP reductase family protein [Nitrospirae bacterium]|nr:PCP reductase family protein [Nitrospirota bacterium]MBF0535234.1 PCP reductase family protein [Nitrospirota bacterium]MBF0615286.1 PCP reductase family protein [Nitrospirota bacterium]